MNNNGHRMQCLQVWAGNETADERVVTTGLDVRLTSEAYNGASGGGDVYYVSSCASGRLTRLLVADVAGHGAAVSDSAQMLRGLMQRNVNHLNQSRFVSEMNREFHDRIDEGFATAIVATYFLPTRTLTLSNAGHPPPLVYRAATGQWQRLDHELGKRSRQPDFPLGIHDASEYGTVKIRLAHDDEVLFYTDAAIEAGHNDKLLQMDGLVSLCNELNHADRDAFVDELTLAIKDYAGGDLGDDVTLLHFSPNDERVSLKDNLMSPFRYFASLFGGREENPLDRSETDHMAAMS